MEGNPLGSTDPFGLASVPPGPPTYPWGTQMPMPPHFAPDAPFKQRAELWSMAKEWNKMEFVSRWAAEQERAAARRAAIMKGGARLRILATMLIPTNSDTDEDAITAAWHREFRRKRAMQCIDLNDPQGKYWEAKTTGNRVSAATHTNIKWTPLDC